MKFLVFGQSKEVMCKYIWRFFKKCENIRVYMYTNTKKYSGRKTSFKNYGEEGLIPKPARPRTCPNETSIRIKERVIELRKETKLCAKKLNWRLEKEGIEVKERTIGNILKSEGLVKKYRTKKMKWKYVKVPLLPGELVEINIYVPGTINGLKYYQFTAIDYASRWRHLEVYDGMGNNCAIKFLTLKQIMDHASRIGM